MFNGNDHGSSEKSSTPPQPEKKPLAGQQTPIQPNPTVAKPPTSQK
jgi:hypothetical protein